MIGKLEHLETPRITTLTNIAGATAVITVCAIYVFAIILPAQARIGNEKRRAHSLLRQSRNISDVEHKKCELSEELKVARGQLQALKNAIPTRTDEDQFLNQLSQFAVASNVTILDFQPGRVSSQGDHASVEIRISATGDYAGICQLAEKIENANRMNQTLGMTLTSNGVVCNLSMTVELFQRVEQAPVTDTNTTLAGRGR